MTPKWWRECSDPRRMRSHLEVFHNVHQTKRGKRKVRLLACACVRWVWKLAVTDEDRQAIAAAERFTDGLMSKQELVAALKTTEKAVDRLWMMADLKPVVPPDGTFREVFGTFTATAPTAEEDQAQCDLLRDLFDGLLQSAVLDRSLLVWNNSTIPGLAQAIYDDRAFDSLPILADALEDAGCTIRGILVHCRQPRVHARGCWLLDLLLGKD